MAKTNRRLKQSDVVKVRQSAVEYFDKQSKFKNLQAKFNEAKRCFNDEMLAYFNEFDITSMRVESDEPAGESLLIMKVQKSNVSFDADKLEAALDKKLAEQVIRKRYEIADISGLIAYLKECGVDPKIFKSFLAITKDVDTKELDRLEEIGKITLNQVKSCYTTNAHKPYFVVKATSNRKDKGESD